MLKLILASIVTLGLSGIAFAEGTEAPTTGDKMEAPAATPEAPKAEKTMKKGKKAHKKMEKKTE